MSPSNGNPEPDERTLLLSKDVPEAIDPSHGDVIASETDGNGNGNGSSSKGDDRDEERGEVEEGGDGNDKVAQKRQNIYARMGSDLNALNNTSWIATA
ncbi:hypothetical protein LCER1_G006058 [Lachnellula cervina]|uniref:Uncharacterized protein n=1 Tax=Lachnellula cervina TaxID=1316786 RepID=A0A7D8YYA7_9HELO|nr:hypothetical protein LCER1_G006058 [Lachnellula cervina]